MQNSKPDIFIVRGLTSDVYSKGEYIVDLNSRPPTISKETMIQDLYSKHLMESKNKKNNIKFRKSCEIICLVFKRTYPEYFI